MATDMIPCSKCGHSNPPDSHDCENCGVTLQLVAAKQERPAPAAETPSPPSKPEPVAPENIMACPKCGQETNALADDCIKCGVIFAKFFEAETQRLQEDPDKAEELEQLKQTMESHLSRRRPMDTANAPESIDDASESEVTPEPVAEASLETTELKPVVESVDNKALNHLLRPKPNLQRLLKPYANKTVGMNVDSPTAIKDVRLVSVNDDYFTVFSEESRLVSSFPLANIVSVTEAVDGVSAGPARNPTRFPMIIRVSHRMV